MFPIYGRLDEPTAGILAREAVTFRGWVSSRQGRVLSVDVLVGDRVLTRLPYGMPRPDVVAAEPNIDSEYCGFDGRVPLDGLAAGRHEFVVRARDAHGDEWSAAVALDVHEQRAVTLAAGLPVRPIAFYLPQYHPIAENDAWWGPGFTEWTNVVRGQPQFPGHEQPHLPADLGFYDLRVPEVREQQAELAREHGIFGFCYYYYWFGGRRLLERPLDDVVSMGSPEFPFCVCWANENWTRRWDGAEHEILVAQQHSPEDDEALIRTLLPVFADRRYIRVAGRPMFLVYRPAILPDAAATTRRWRDICRDAGTSEPYLVAVQSFGLGDPRPYGFDAAVEFPPHSIHAAELTGRIARKNPDFTGHVYDYLDVAEHASNRPPKDYTLFRGVMPSWDNTARRRTSGHIYYGSTPSAYARWLTAAAAHAQDELPPDRRFVFINAWNEWGEGCHLEPDERHGHAYLRATRDVVRRTVEPDPAPLVSVVVPTYNRADQVGEALSSVFEQTYEHIEIIVVNDGSTDDTIRTLAAFRSRHAGRRIRVINKPNGGAHAAINDGLRAAEGTYVAILNDDDRYAPDRVMLLVDALRASGARFAFSLCRFIDERGRTIASDDPRAATFSAKQRGAAAFPAIGYALLDYNVAISTGNFFMERSLFEDVGDFADLRYCHDWDFALRTLRFGDPVIVPRELYEYRIHGANQFSVLQDLAEAETRNVLTRFFAESEELVAVPDSYPGVTNFGTYHERFLEERGYQRFVPSMRRAFARAR